MSSKFIAICEGTADSIWASGETEQQAKSRLWVRVHNYLVLRKAPETSTYNREKLEDYFGCVVLDLSENGGFLKF